MDAALPLFAPDQRDRRREEFEKVLAGASHGGVIEPVPPKN